MSLLYEISRIVRFRELREWRLPRESGIGACCLEFQFCKMKNSRDLLLNHVPTLNTSELYTWRQLREQFMLCVFTIVKFKIELSKVGKTKWQIEEGARGWSHCIEMEGGDHHEGWDGMKNVKAGMEPLGEGERRACWDRPWRGSWSSWPRC